MLNSFENALRITLDAERQAAERDDNNWPPVGWSQYSETYSTSTVDDVHDDFRSQDDAGEKVADMYLDGTLLAPERGFANIAPPPRPGAPETVNPHAKLRVIDMILVELERERSYPALLPGQAHLQSIAQLLDCFREAALRDVGHLVSQSHQPFGVRPNSRFDRTIFSRLRARLESQLPSRSDHQFGAAGSYQEEQMLVKLVTKYSHHFRTVISLEHLGAIARDIDGDLDPTPEIQQAKALTNQVEQHRSYDLCGADRSSRDVMLSYAEAKSWLELKKVALSDGAYQRRATAFYSACQAYTHSRRLLREIQFAYKQGVLNVYCNIETDTEAFDDQTRNVSESWIDEDNRDEKEDTAILVQLEGRVAAAEGRSMDSAAQLADWEENIRRRYAPA
ncbi:hypothetical protein EXIGLDRAFT_752678 [Exidia glandulosa HHB12029]|uniref:Uncharacterized protein n=1 Tax=Exidia glandulosa HHB12029 TaxID=1314781 RepID=A0A165EDK3_EXIGL|nr:hypothetical protein EXIGLDRAFT_752678 [Exidia glandulosa HHB12029]